MMRSPGATSSVRFERASEKSLATGRTVSPFSFLAVRRVTAMSGLFTSENSQRKDLRRTGFAKVAVKPPSVRFTSARSLTKSLSAACLSASNQSAGIGPGSCPAGS